MWSHEFLAPPRVWKPQGAPAGAPDLELELVSNPPFGRASPEAALEPCQIEPKSQAYSAYVIFWREDPGNEWIESRNSRKEGIPPLPWPCPCAAWGLGSGDWIGLLGTVSPCAPGPPAPVVVLNPVRCGAVTTTSTTNTRQTRPAWQLASRSTFLPIRFRAPSHKAYSVRCIFIASN